MIWTKGAHQRAKLQSFDCSRKVSPNLYFDRLLLLKVYKISAKKVQRSYVSWHWRVMQNLKKNWFDVSKMTRIWLTLTWALEILKISSLIGSFCAKYYDTDGWYKIWRKTYLWFGKWRGIWQIFTRAFESLKIRNLMGSFYPKYKMYELKIYRGSYVSWQWRMIQTLKRNWYVVSKLIRGIVEFWPEHSKGLKIFHFNDILLTKVYNVWIKKYRRVMFNNTDEQ